MRNQNGAHVQFLLQFVDQLHDLILNGNVERSRRLIRNQQLRPCAQRHGNHRTLTHAAGKLEGILIHAHFRRRNADHSQQLYGALFLFSLRHRLAVEHFHQLMLDFQHRRQRGHRLLEDDAHLLAAQLAQFLFLQVRNILTIQNNLAAYDANGLLLSATNCDGVKVTYEYYTTREPFRVKRVRITGGTLCAYDRTYEYKDCLTVVTDNLSGKKLFYHFNDYGNCISVNDQLGYAAFAKYSDSNPVNHPETISKMQRSVVNLLKNHNFESSDGWSFTNANSAAGNTIDYSTDSPHMGTRCVKATVVDGFRCDMQQWVTLERGKTYTASYYAKCTGSMRVWLETYTSDEGWTVFEKPPVQAVSAYQRYQNSFIVPGTSGTCSVYIGIRIGSGNGTAWVDNVQLEEGPVANRYNMLINGDFTFNSGAHPTGWSKNSSNDASDIVYTTCTGTKPEGLSANTMRMYGIRVILVLQMN